MATFSAVVEKIGTNKSTKNPHPHSLRIHRFSPFEVAIT